MQAELAVAVAEVTTKGQPCETATQRIRGVDFTVFVNARSIGAAGYVAVAMNAWWSGDELEYGIKDSGLKLLFTDAERTERLLGRLERLAIELVTVRHRHAGLTTWEEFLDGASNAMPETPIAMNAAVATCRPTPTRTGGAWIPCSPSRKSKPPGSSSWSTRTCTTGPTTSSSTKWAARR